MPIQPAGSELYISAPLTNVSVAYQQDMRQFVADQVFPMVGVELQGGMYWEYLMDDWTRTVADERAPATESAGGGWEVKTEPYFARVYAVHKDIDGQTRTNARGGGFNLDREATQWVTEQLLIRREKLFLDQYMGPGIWGSDRTVVNKWDTINGTPIEDITNAALDMGEITGLRPNTMLLGARVLPALLNSAQIIERVKYSGSGFPTEAVLAQAFNIGRIMTLNAIENLAPKGAPKVTQYMKSNSVLLLYAAPNPGLMTPSAGYTFAWTGLLGAGALGTRMKNFRMENIDSDRIEGEMAFDMRIVGKDLGIYFPNVLS